MIISKKTLKLMDFKNTLPLRIRIEDYKRKHYGIESCLYLV